MRRSRFLALLAAIPLTAAAAPPAADAATGPGYRARASVLFRGGHPVATMRNPRTAARCAALGNRGIRSAAARGAGHPTGPYANHGRTILQGGIRIGFATNRRLAAATARNLDLGAALVRAAVPGAPTGVRGVRRPDGTVVVRFSPPRHVGSSAITHYTVTATRIGR